MIIPFKQNEDAAWTKHPRPQFKREHYYILHDNWTLNGQAIQVPFPPQATLSGYHGDIADELIYLCSFTIPASFRKKRILLHFGAVDQIAKVYINDTLVGENAGGYLPFSFDVTDAIHRHGENTLKVVATDSLCTDYPYGKQTKHPNGMWYTPVSGIWQNVWLENVPDTHITGMKIQADLEQVEIHLTYNSNETALHIFEVTVTLPTDDMPTDNSATGKTFTQSFAGNSGSISIPNGVYWTPDNPQLYPITITAGEDIVESYFALRTIGIENVDGINRVCLNHQPIFLHGVLDQGYYHDGLFLPKEESGYDTDILNMKNLGYNLLRKHIKIEPDYFYYACDKLGMLVMQDMVNSGEYSFLRDTAFPTIGWKKKKDAHLTADNLRRQIFMEQTRLTIEHLYNHPCIIAYTIFNEGWGQFDSDEMYDYVKTLDNTRLVDSTSGWFAQTKNDFDSEHIYFRLKKLRNMVTEPARTVQI